jgi:hypothetical protein
LAPSCAAHAPPPIAASRPPSAAEARRPTGALHGLWVEYWAKGGKADTQRYVFLPDGRFAWQAPDQEAPPQRAVRKAGHFELHGQGVSEALVLYVSLEEFAACSAPCAQASAGLRQVEHSPPLVEQYELGECAPNQEAEAQDAHYACRAIDGRAFWRQPLTAAGLPPSAPPPSDAEAQAAGR